MNRKLNLYIISGIVFTIIVGTLLHFVYEWSGSNSIVGLFSPINESVWEHMKLLYFPMLFYALIESRFFRDRTDFWCVKLIGIVAGLILIPTLFYTINGSFGKSPDWINIAIFFIAAAAAYLAETYLYNNALLKCPHPRLAIFVIVLVGILFVVFTFITPQIPLFLDPVSGKYGIQ